MGLFDKFMDVLYEDVPGSPAPQRGPAAPAPSGNLSPSQMLKQKSSGGVPASSPAPASTPGPAASGSSASASASLSASTGVDEKVYKEFCDSLSRAIESANLPGFDFFEFHQLYKRFRAEGKSESEAVQTSLTSAETMRVNKNTLLANYKHYDKVLGQQKATFEDELGAFYNENIKGAHEKQQQIDKDVAAREQEIIKLQKEIESLKEQKENMGVNAQKAAQQTEEVKAAFGKAFDEVSSELRALVDKIAPGK